MFSKMSGDRLPAVSDHAVPLDSTLKDGVRGEPDVAALASLDQGKLCVLVWHYHDDDLPGAAANVTLQISGLNELAQTPRVTHFCIDETHSNAFTVWKRQGSPQLPTPSQYAELEKAGQLEAVSNPNRPSQQAAALTFEFQLPRQAVSLVVLDWTPR
jgi:xylan 1,4-beta-xylosidase